MSAAAIWTPSQADAARARAEARGITPGQDAGPPLGAARMPNFPMRRDAQNRPDMRAQLVEWEGKERYQLDGYATVWNRPYEMWDFFGPYTESVASDAADVTLAAGPDVAFLLNHRGMTMARTATKDRPGPGTLFLDADGMGMHSRAYVNPERQDVKDMITAIDDRDIDEMSFAFLIIRGAWNDDFTHYEILEFDIDRGDVSAVNYGANPYTSIGARAQQLLADLDQLPVGLARAAMTRLGRREDVTALAAPVTLTVDSDAVAARVAASIAAEPATRPAPPTPTGRSVAMLAAELQLEDDETGRTR